MQKKSSAWFWVFSFLVACSTDQCSCAAFEQRDFPTRALDVTVPAAGQVRVTASGLDYVEKQVPYLIDQFVPNGLNFCIPQDTSGNPDLCVASTCPGGAAGCGIDLTIDDQNISTLPPDRLEVSVTIGDVDERLNFDYGTFIGTVNCYVQLFKKGASETTPAQIVGTIPIRLGIDGVSPTKDLRVEIGEPVLNLDGVDFKIHGRGNVGDTVACEGASLVRGLFRGMIEDQVTTILSDTVDKIADEQLCRRCGAGFDACDAGACDEGICRYASGVCVPRPLGVEGRLNLGSLLVGYVQEPNASVDVLAKAGDVARVDTGVTAGLRAGFEPNQLAPCVPVDPTRRPSAAAIPVSSVIASDRDPAGQAFHFGVGIHKRAVEHMLWSTWASGAPCLEVGSETVSLLSTGTFQLLAPSLKDVGPAGSTAVLAVVPQKPPTVVFGANEITQVNGSYAITQPLMTLYWPDVDFHVFGYAQERMLRLFSLRVDLELPVALSPDGQGNLIPVVGAIEDAIRNIRPRRTELIAEGPQRILDLVPTLVGFAAPQLAGAIPDSVALPEFLGFRLDLQQGDVIGADNNQFLALFATLARTTQPVLMRAETLARQTTLDLSHHTVSGLVRPRVVVEVGVLHGLDSGATAEYQWRVDGGFWSLFQDGPELVVADPVLSLPGLHTLEVRARFKGAPASVDATPVVWSVDVREPSPLVTPMGSSLEDTEETVLVPAVGAAMRSEGTNVSGAGCSATSGHGSWWVIGGLLLGFGRRSRRTLTRRRMILGWLGGVVLLGLLGCKGSVSTNATTRCFGPECAVDQACALDVDCRGLCPAGTSGICEAEQCQCVRACEPGCGPDEFCCLGSGVCVASAPSCDGRTCGEGFEPRVVGVPNRDTCEIDGGGCECVALPELPIGVHGQQLAVDSRDGTTVIAAYNKTYGDLMVGQTAADLSVQWTIVDGVPDSGPLTGDPMGWRGGRAEKGAHVGTYPAVALSDSGTVHLVYRDEDNKTLKYARGPVSGPFESGTLETEGDPMWTSAVMVGTTLHVIYGVDAVAGNSSLRHAAIAVDAPIGNLAPITTAVAEAEVDPSDTMDFPRRMGMFADLSATPQGGLLAVFYDGIGKRVGRSVFSGGVWSPPEFVATGTGPFAAGAVDAQGLVHLVFMSSGGLRYSRFGGEVLTKLVHDGRRDGDEYFAGPIGEDVDVVVAQDGLRVVFQDAFDRALYEARWNGDGFDLAKIPLPASQAGGFYSTYSPAGDVYVDWLIDRTVEPWGRIRVLPLSL